MEDDDIAHQSGFFREPAVPGTIIFTTSAGAPFNISLVQLGGVGGVGSRFSFSLSGGQTLKLVSTGAKCLDDRLRDSSNTQRDCHRYDYLFRIQP